MLRKYDFQNGKQRYKCNICGKYFSGGQQIVFSVLWQEYSSGKQTYKQLAEKYNYSAKAIQRKLDEYQIVNQKKQPRSVLTYHISIAFLADLQNEIPCIAI